MSSSLQRTRDSARIRLDKLLVPLGWVFLKIRFVRTSLVEGKKCTKCSIREDKRLSVHKVRRNLACYLCLVATFLSSPAFYIIRHKLFPRVLLILLKW